MNKNSILTVHQLTKDAEEKAATAYQEALAQHQKNERQLAALESYRIEYHQQLNQQTNISMSSYLQLQAFITQIGKAISEQMKSLTQTDKQRLDCQKKWFDSQTKRKAIETLISHKLQLKVKQENIQEQKLTDEHTQQQYWHFKYK